MKSDFITKFLFLLVKIFIFLGYPSAAPVPGAAPAYQPGYPVPGIPQPYPTVGQVYPGGAAPPPPGFVPGAPVPPAGGMPYGAAVPHGANYPKQHHSGMHTAGYPMQPGMHGYVKHGK